MRNQKQLQKQAPWKVTAPNLILMSWKFRFTYSHAQQYIFVAIKKQMEKDIDAVMKIARMAKTKIDELEKDVCYSSFLAVSASA